VDRFDRRKVLILADLGAGLVSAGILALLLLDLFTPVRLVALVALGAAFASFQWPAYQAATAQLVASDSLSRANGMIQVSDALANLLPPAIAGAILAVWSIEAVIMIDLATFVVAVATLVSVRFPPVPPSEIGAKAASNSVAADAMFGFNYIRSRRDLRLLLTIQFALGAVSSMTIILLTGYILEISDERTLGFIVSVAASGFMLGALAMSVWRGLQAAWIRSIMLLTAAIAVLQVTLGLVPSLAAIGTVLFLIGVLSSGQNAAYRSYWQLTVERDLQGRVFSARALVALASAPVGYLVTGPLLDGPISRFVESGAWPAFGQPPAADYRMLYSLGGLALLVVIVLLASFRTIDDTQ
jgi:MFS family permease